MIYRELSSAAKRFRESSQLISAQQKFSTAQLSFFFQNLQLCLGCGSPRFEKLKRGPLTEMIIMAPTHYFWILSVFRLKPLGVIYGDRDGFHPDSLISPLSFSRFESSTYFS